MDCNGEVFANTRQVCASYLILKKSDETEKFIDKWLHGVFDERIFTDLNNQMGKLNKEGIKPFLDSSQFGNSKKGYTDGIVERSLYPQIFDSHINGYITSSCILYRLHEYPMVEKKYYYIGKLFERKLKE